MKTSKARLSYNDFWRNNHREKYLAISRKSNKKWRRNLKFEILSHYGKNGKAQCRWRSCTVVDLDGLTLDHVKNNGTFERRLLGPMSSNRLYMLLKISGWPKGYQTLCGTHQWIKENRRRRKSGK